MNKETEELFEWIWETRTIELKRQVDQYEKRIKLDTY